MRSCSLAGQLAGPGGERGAAAGGLMAAGAQGGEAATGEGECGVGTSVKAWHNFFSLQKPKCEHKKNTVALKGEK